MKIINIVVNQNSTKRKKITHQKLNINMKFVLNKLIILD